MRKQYHFRISPNGFYAWDVERLINLSNSIDPMEVTIGSIEELNQPFWFDHGYTPSCRAVAEHAKLIYEVDLTYPIILCPSMKIMDGMHRVCKAYLNGLEYIQAKQFLKIPAPDYIDIQPNELDYT
ncbi:hypothetical protein OAO18_03015 [Francisellaceae bacterium]|nr:hypothetical protein [Francisellaceae bacterium]